jgi:hypothetical protein
MLSAETEARTLLWAGDHQAAVDRLHAAGYSGSAIRKFLRWNLPYAPPMGPLGATATDTGIGAGGALAAAGLILCVGALFIGCRR